MSKLKDLTLAYLEAADERLKEIISEKTTAAEQVVRAKVVIPYCKKYGYRFFAGMGSWSFSDRDGDNFYPGETRHKKRGRNPLDPKHDDDSWFIEPTDEDRELLEILSWSFGCMNQSIGSFLQDYAP